MKCQTKANKNREAVVVCARHVLKRPSKRMRASSNNHFWKKSGFCPTTWKTKGSPVPIVPNDIIFEIRSFQID